MGALHAIQRSVFNDFCKLLYFFENHYVICKIFLSFLIDVNDFSFTFFFVMGELKNDMLIQRPK
jgi:hypothetical protein